MTHTATPAPRPAGLDALSGTRKAAILLIALGSDTAAAVLRHLSPEEIEELTVEIARLRDVPADLLDAVIADFADLAGARSYLLQGGIQYARDTLERAVGAPRAKEILERLPGPVLAPPLAMLQRVDPSHLAEFLRREDAQTCAVILAHLDPPQAAQVLSELPPDLRVPVVERLASLETTSPEVLKGIEQVLERRLAALSIAQAPAAGGPRAAAELLNRTERAVEKQVFEGLEISSPGLAEQIRALMVTFDDLVRLDDRGMRRLLAEVDQKDLALALKAASERVRQRIFANLSERAQTMLRQELDFLGPVRLRDAEEAQTRIVRRVRALEEAGEIVLHGPQDTDVYV
jgi:flagellar motor switch protein FliG